MIALSKAGEGMLRRLSTAHGRRGSPYFVAEGVRLCAEAIRRRPQWIEWAVVSDAEHPQVAALTEAAGFPVYALRPDRFAKLSDTRSPQGIMLLLRRPPWAAGPADDPFVLLLDQITDPGNLGTILRTAWAVGLRHVALTDGGVDPFSPKVVRAAMGAHFAVSMSRHDDLVSAAAHLAAAGYPELWEAGPRESVSCFSEDFDIRGGVLVVGNETRGPTPMNRSRGVCIPMPGAAESINVAQAATVLLFEIVRRGVIAASAAPPVTDAPRAGD